MSRTDTLQRRLAIVTSLAMIFGIIPTLSARDIVGGAQTPDVACGCSTEYPEECWCEDGGCGCCWTFAADALFLDRSSPERRDLIFANVAGNPGAPIFNAGDFDADIAVGPRLILSRKICDCGSWIDGVEFNAFGVDGWRSEASVTGPAHVIFPGFVQPLIAGVPPGVGTATYINTSNLFSAEFNVTRRTNDWLTLLAGARWLEVGDELLLQFTPAGGAPTNMFTIDANNHLYGGQLGALVNVANIGLWQVDSWFKAGAYYNSADQSTDVFFPVRANVGDRDDDSAFVGDIAVTGVRQITDRLSLRAGYQLLWIEGVALAPDQLNGILDITVPIAVLNTNSGIFYHGGFVGAQLDW